MNKVYSRIFWKNYPSEDTPLNEKDLNQMDLGIDNLDNRLVEMDAVKVNKEVANNLVKTWSIDEETGIITVEHLDGSKDLFDLNIEKIPVNFELSDNGILTMTTDDGTQYTANIGAMIPVLTFEDSDEIAVTVTGTGANKTYSFSIKAGSVTEDKLQPNFLADVKTEVAKAHASQSAAAQSASAASSSARLAESYTHGGTGAREGEETDNAKYYMEQAKAVSAVDIATTEKAGIVKPDGETITVDPDGTLHGQSKVSEMTGATAEANGTSGTVPAPLAGQENHVLKGNGAWEAITYDSELSAESENAPQTKVVYAKTKEIEKNLSQLSNPNLLINPDFRINQRGGKIALSGAAFYGDENCTVYQGTIDNNYKVEAITNGNYKFLNVNGDAVYIKASDVVDGYCEGGKYSVDRWIVYRGAVKVLNTGIYYIPNPNFQYYDNFYGIKNESDIFVEGKYYTCSVCHDDSEIDTLTFKYEKHNTWTVISENITKDGKINIRAAADNNLLNIDFMFHAEAIVNWVKLELGSVATPFIPPDPATELLKCQRYYWKITTDTSINRNKYIASGMVEGGSDIYYLLNYPVEMRTYPTLVVSDVTDFVVSLGVAVYAQMGSIQLTNISLANISKHNTRFKAVANKNLSDYSGHSAFLRFIGDATTEIGQYLALDAEIY